MSQFKNINTNLKPREKLMRTGASKLSDAELLAIILQSGSKGISVITLANQLIEQNGGLTKIFNLTNEDLRKYKGIGEAKSLKLIVISEINRRIAEQSVAKEIVRIKKPEDIFQFLKIHFNQEQEEFYLITMDTKNKIINYRQIFVGSLTNVAVHPREIFKEAILRSAHKIVLAHNHPSGDVTPSPEDLDVTQKLIRVGQLIGISVLDHVIFSHEKYYSMGENNSELFLE